jgi:hypothetical protein
VSVSSKGLGSESEQVANQIFLPPMITVPARYENEETQATFEKSVDMKYLEDEVSVWI